MKDSRIKFKPDPTAPKPYNFAALQKFMAAESKRFEREFARRISAGNPWLDLLFTGGTFQVFLGKKQPSWISGEPVNCFRFPDPRDL